MSKIYYRPTLPNGRKVPLNLAVKIFCWTNHICWPLDDNVPSWIYALDRIYLLFGLMLFMSHIESDFRYLYIYFNNLDEFLTGIPTLLVSIEVYLRGFHLAFKNDRFKKFLQRFFNEIYIQKTVHPKLYHKIHRRMRPVFIQSTFFIFTLISYTIIQPIYILYTGERELLYKSIPPWEYKEHLYVYYPMLIMHIWIGFIVATSIFGELNILSSCVLHLNGRYTLMRQKFHNKVEKILQNDLNPNLLAKYRHLVIETLEENLRLNKFSMDLQNEFSFRIFIMFAFSAITLCALVFKVYTSPMNSIKFMFWTVAKIEEILALGEIGSSIIATTDKVSSIYYESKWESIIERSSDAKENVRLMKLINLSIAANSNPINLKGFHFFEVSLPAALTILQGAWSYFTFLIALRKPT